MKELKILGEEVLSDHRGLRRVRRYLKGWYPERGRLHIGRQKKETVEEIDVIRPIGVYEVVEDSVLSEKGRQVS